MKQNTTLGHSEFQINRIGLGCMGMSEFYGSFDEEESINTLHKAIDLGLNFFDTAGHVLMSTSVKAELQVRIRRNSPLHWLD